MDAEPHRCCSPSSWLNSSCSSLLLEEDEEDEEDEELLELDDAACSGRLRGAGVNGREETPYWLSKESVFSASDAIILSCFRCSLAASMILRRANDGVRGGYDGPATSTFAFLVGGALEILKTPSLVTSTFAFLVGGAVADSDSAARAVADFASPCPAANRGSPPGAAHPTLTVTA